MFKKLSMVCLTMATIALLPGCGPTNTVTGSDISPATSKTMKLVSNVSPFGNATFDPQGKLTDPASIIGISEVDGYTAVIWWTMSGDLYMSEYKDGKWIITDRKLALPEISYNTYRFTVWGDRLYYFVGDGVDSSRIIFTDGTISSATPISLPYKLQPGLLDHASPDGITFFYKAADGELHLVRMTDGTDVVVNDKDGRIRHGLITAFYADLNRKRIFIKGRKGQTSSLDISTGEPARDHKGQVTSPSLEASIIGDGSNLYAIPYVASSDTMYTIQKFDYSLQPNGTLKVPIMPENSLYSWDTTRLTASGPYLHVWRVFTWENHMALERIEILK